MSRRKHLLQTLQQGVEPPGEGQHIVRALGSRGSNIIEVEFPDGRSTLCLLPAKFHKKLWIRKGSFLIVEDAPEASAEGHRVTGFVAAVLYADHVKQLRRMPGVWPPEFEGSSSAAANNAAEQLAAMGLAESDTDDDAAVPAGSSHNGSSQRAAAAGSSDGGEQQTQGQHPRQQGEAVAAAGEAPEHTEEEGSEGEYSSSEDDLPPIPRFNNRKVIEYAVSDSDSDED
ncbi:hypothetical protein ABPG75_009071 [Micractinium tetrahymenae]